MAPSHHEPGRGVRRAAPWLSLTSSDVHAGGMSLSVVGGCGRRGATGPFLQPVSTGLTTSVGVGGDGPPLWYGIGATARGTADRRDGMETLEKTAEIPVRVSMRTVHAVPRGMGRRSETTETIPAVVEAESGGETEAVEKTGSATTEMTQVWDGRDVAFPPLRPPKIGRASCRERV